MLDVVKIKNLLICLLMVAIGAVVALASAYYVFKGTEKGVLYSYDQVIANGENVYSLSSETQATENGFNASFKRFSGYKQVAVADIAEPLNLRGNVELLLKGNCTKNAKVKLVDVADDGTVTVLAEVGSRGGEESVRVSLDKPLVSGKHCLKVVGRQTKNVRIKFSQDQVVFNTESVV